MWMAVDISQWRNIRRPAQPTSRSQAGPQQDRTLLAGGVLPDTEVGMELDHRP